MKIVKPRVLVRLVEWDMQSDKLASPNISASDKENKMRTDSRRTKNFGSSCGGSGGGKKLNPGGAGTRYSRIG